MEELYFVSDPADFKYVYDEKGNPIAVEWVMPCDAPKHCCVITDLKGEK